MRIFFDIFDKEKFFFLNSVFLNRVGFFFENSLENVSNETIWENLKREKKKSEEKNHIDIPRISFF